MPSAKTITPNETIDDVPILASLDRGEWLKLPIASLPLAGPAVQTLAAILKKTSRETFLPVEEVAEVARLPVTTCRKHIKKLAKMEQGWINNVGRQSTRSGIPRRTCTIKITTKTTAALSSNGYLPLPFWACGDVAGTGELPWSAKALIAIVMGRAMSIIGQSRNHAALADVKRFAFSLAYLERMTGLKHQTLASAKDLLNDRGIIGQHKTEHDHGGTATDLLTPNFSLAIGGTEGTQIPVKGYADSGNRGYADSGH
jgi:hypothetical protein